MGLGKPGSKNSVLSLLVKGMVISGGKLAGDVRLREGLLSKKRIFTMREFKFW